MDEQAVDRAAGLIHAARRSRRPLDRLPDDSRPETEADGYRVQAALNRLLAAAGAGPRGGHKIGCTTPIMQAYLDISNPCAGEVFEQEVHRGAGEFHVRDHTRMGVECEIAVELGTNIDGARGFARAEMVDAVAAAMASIEVVDDRYVDYGTIGTPTLIADDFFNAGAVLGEPIRSWRRLDLASLGGRMAINGVDVGSGVGADILGHPLEALSWLAASMAARGRRLRAGEFVTLGSLVLTQWVSAGDEVLIEIDGLGQARATFV